MRQWIALLVSLWFASAFDSGAGSLEIDARSLSSLEASGARIHPSVAAGAADGALRFSDGGIEVPMGQLLSPQAGTVRIDFRTPAVWPAEGDQTLFHIGEEAHVHVTLFFRNGGLISVYKGGEDFHASVPFRGSTGWTADSPHSIEFAWKAEGKDVPFLLRVDGDLIGVGAGRLIETWPERFFIGERGPGRNAWRGTIETASIAPLPMRLPEAEPGDWAIDVDLAQPGGIAYNFWSIGNFTSQDMFARPEERATIRRTKPFMRYVNCVRLLGGRDDGKNEWFKGTDANGDPVCDFSDMLLYLRGILEWGYTPRSVLDNVPTAMSDPPQMNTYGNTYPPKDYDLYHKFIRAAVKAMIDEFGLETVGAWRFRVMTEPDLNPGHWAGTREEYFRLYDYAVDAVTSLIPDADIGPGNVLDPNENPNAARQIDRWGLDAIDHAATGTNYKTGQTGTRLRHISCSWYGHVGRSIDTFEPAIRAMRERLERYPQFRGLPVEVAEFSVLTDGGGRRFMGCESTEWSASFMAAIADRAYRQNVAQIHQWGQTGPGLLPSPYLHTLSLLERMAGGERFPVAVSGPPNSAADVGAIACQKDGRLFVLLYNHRALREPKLLERIELRIRHPRFRDGEQWLLTETGLDEERGVCVRQFEADCQAAGLEPNPKTPAFGSNIAQRWGPKGNAIFEANRKRYEAMAQMPILRERETIRSADGEIALRLETPTHSVRMLEFERPMQ